MQYIDAMSIAQRRNPIIPIARIVTWVVISVTLVALVYNVQFAAAQGDDYLFSRLARELGAGPFVVHRYQSWNGRFASDIWYGVIYSIVNVTTRPWAGAGIIVLVTAGTWYGYARLFGAYARESGAGLRAREQGNRDAFALAGVLLFFYLLVIHTSILYGVSTGVPYQVGPAHLLGQMAGLCALVRSMHRTERHERVTTGKRRRQYAAAVGLALSALFISGYRESLIPLSLLFYGAGALWSFHHNRRTLWVWVAVSVAAVIGGIIVFVAPGNAVRFAFVEERQAIAATASIVTGETPGTDISPDSTFLGSLWRYIWLSVYGVARILGIFFCYLFVLLHIPAVRTQLLRYIGTCTQWVQSSAPVFRAGLMLCYPGIIVAANLPDLYVFNSLGSTKLHMIIYFFLIAALAPVGASFRCTALYGWCARQYAALSARSAGRAGSAAITAARYAAVALLVFASVALQFDTVHERLPGPLDTIIKSTNSFPGSVYNLTRDALFTGPQFRTDRESLFRYAAQLPNKSEQHLLVPPFCPIPKSIHYYSERLSQSPQNYPNAYTARYLGIASIRIPPGLYCYNNTTLVTR